MNKPAQTPFSHDNYSDIINLPRPISKTHPRMSKAARAAQFAPYAALVGHRDIIAHEENLASQKLDLDHKITTELSDELEAETNFDFNQENPLDS